MGSSDPCLFRIMLHTRTTSPIFVVLCPNGYNQSKVYGNGCSSAMKRHCWACLGMNSCLILFGRLQVGHE